MEFEEAVKILENFKNNKLEHDKLEIRYHGGFKMGDIYKFTELNPAIETLLNHLTKQEKMIDEMIKVMSDRNICKYFIENYCKHYAGENKKTCNVCIKQYFEKKAEEEISNGRIC